MKRYVHAVDIDDTILDLIKVTSITLVDNAFDFEPRNHEASISVTSAKKLKKDYSNMTREQLLNELTEKELANIKDVTVLRKLKKDELTLDQQILVGQANEKYSDKSSPREIQKVLDKLKQCKSFFIWGTTKNKSFYHEIEELGGQVDNSDLKKIIKMLEVKDFTEFTLSYLDTNWNSLLMVAEYRGEYTFKADDEDGQDVTIKNLDLYIKIDINGLDGEGVGAMSFHHPDYKMKHPHANYRRSEHAEQS